MSKPQILAIVGVANRFPGGGNSPDDFWRNLVSLKDCISEATPDRWNARYYTSKDKDRPGKCVTSYCGFVDRIFEFDYEAFGISKREAEMMDPQQKMLLEVSLAALEDAGFKYHGSKTGVFIGVGVEEHFAVATADNDAINPYSVTGATLSINANRISFVFNLHGPSMSIDTACSSSLTAFHEACKAIRDGDCEQALVGGVNMILNPSVMIQFSKLGVLSPEGRCKSFDKKADGYVRAEGCGVVILKPLEAALRDRDHIYCLVRGSACNSDGKRSPSLTMPSADAQKEVFRRAAEVAGIDPHRVFYVEAHATGTKVGDPIEANSIGEVFGGSDRTEWLRIGSVKSNIGHLECASFMAGLIKSVLMLDRGTLVPNLHFTEPNPEIHFEKYKLRVQTEVEKFDSTNKLVAVSSFGFGGSNGCVILEGFGNCALPKISHFSFVLTAPYLFILSAETSKALETRIEQTKQLQVITEPTNGEVLTSRNLSATLIRRQVHRYVSFGVGTTPATTVYCEPKLSSSQEPIVWVFGGQGPQHYDMGRQLYQIFPVFRTTIDKCDAVFSRVSGYSLVKDVGLFGPNRGPDADAVHNLKNTLPALIFIQIALVDLWKSFGIVPSAVIGHSFGELAAGYAANICTLEQIVEIAYYRSKLLQKLDGKGMMMAIGASAETITPWLVSENGVPSEQRAWIAAYNSPESITVGGYPDAIQKLATKCQEQKIFHRILKINNAYHTPIMSSLRDEALSLFATTLTSARAPTVPFFSTVHAEWKTDKFDGHYMWMNIERPVRFQAAIAACLERFGKNVLFIELTPHPILSTNMKQCGAKNCLYSLHREQPEQSSLLNAIANLLTYNYTVNIDALFGTISPAVTLHNNTLPYPFQNTYCWSEDKSHEMARVVPEGNYATLLGTITPHPELDTWCSKMSLARHSWIADHVVQETPVFPGAGYVEMAFEALKTTSLSNIVIGKVLTLVGNERRDVRVTAERTKSKVVKIFSKSNQWDKSDWVLHASAQLSDPMSLDVDESWIRDIQKAVTSPRAQHRTWNKKDCYERFKSIGLSYGPIFQGIVSLTQTSDTTGFAVVDMSHLDATDREDDFVVHPAVLDVCFQAFLSSCKVLNSGFVPISIERVDWEDVADRRLRDTNSNPSCGPTRKFIVYAKQRPIVAKAGQPDGCLQGDLVIFDPLKNRIFGRVIGLVMSPIASGSAPVEQKNFTVTWQTWELPSIHFKSDAVPTVLNLPEVNAARHLESIFDLACVSYMSRALKTLPVGFEKSVPLHRQRYLAWCKEQVDAKVASVTATSERAIDGQEIMKTEAEAVKRVGENLPQLLRDPPLAQKILFSDDLMERLYDSVTFAPFVRSLATMVSSVIKQLLNRPDNKNRVLRILEVGAGTGALTKKLLPQLEGVAFKYVFTDISKKFLNDAQQMFASYSNIEYKLLNLEKDIVPQGIKYHSMDIVLAFDVLHVASDLTVCLEHIHQMLVPNGLLMAIEPTRPSIWFNMFFGLFREWWSFTDIQNRPKYCTLSRSEWTSILPRQQFHNISIVSDVSEPQTPEFCHSIIVAQSSPLNYECSPSHESIPNGVESDVPSTKPFHYFSSGTVDDLLVQSKEWLLSSKESQVFFVVTHGAQPVPSDDDIASTDAPLIGFTRVLAAEHPSRDIRLVDMPLNTPPATEKLWLKRIFKMIEAKKFNEREFAIRNDQLWVPRLKLISTNENSDPLTASFATSIASKNETNDIQFKLAIGHRGQLNTLHYTEVTQPTLTASAAAQLGEGEILVDVRAAALNFKDLMLALGMITVPSKNGGLKPIELGLEFSGEVVAVGSGVRSFKCGDEVFGIGTNCLANRLRVPQDLVFHKPPHLSHAEAASIPIAFTTSYAALIMKAKLQPGESVLIHSGAGGIGQASIQLAKHVGAEIIATVGSDDKRQYLREKYGVTKFSSSHQNDVWYREVKTLTDGRGVDVVLNSLKGKAIEYGILSLTLGGRFVEIGKVDILENTTVGLAPFLQDLSFHSVQLDVLMDDSRGMAFVRRCFEEVARLAADRAIVPIVDQIFAANDIEHAFRYLMSGKHKGKIVIDFSRENWPRMQSIHRSLFNPGTLYVISGGLGAVGWETMKWMSANGAYRFLLLSRQGISGLSESQNRDLAVLQGKGVRVLIKQTDVTDQNQVVQAYREARIQGLLDTRVAILHMAMTLHDTPIQKMNVTELHRVIDCKIDGARNLVEYVTKAAVDCSVSIEFVLLFSSVSSIFGNPDQANYAAGNSFLDQYAFELRARGFGHVNVINLSAVEDVGVLAEDFKKRQMVRLRGMNGGLTCKQVFEQIQRMITHQSIVQWIFGNFNFKHLIEQFPFLESKVDHLIDYRTQHGVDREATGEQQTASIDSLKQLVARLLACDPRHIDPQVPLVQIGLDSLLAVELSSNLKKAFNIKVSQMELLGGLSIEKLLERTA
jgi:acyl transferase domain-containing protein/NADPH:quinone reductase-like Zn-dependent oxidoreductase/SAM-dependent methyltransferase/NAD(P)-dependent dehydrogenase (short-subunit alcohol dehydrogenase family)/acyl carrier protein